MKPSVQFFLLIAVWFVGVAQTATSKTVECTKPKGPICVIQSLPPSDGVSTTIEFPDLSTRTGLRVLEGKLSNLTDVLAVKLTVRNLWMEGLHLKSVFVRPEFEKLHFRGNQLATLQTSASSSFALKLLDVRQNVLKNATQLAPFDLLEELYLDDNQLTQLSVDLFAKMQKLRVLSASGNGIVQIVPPTRMLVFSELVSLSLAHNQLVSLVMDNWQLPALQMLQLNNNSLSELTGMEGFGQFYDLREMKLSGNRWSCGWLQHALGNVIVRTSSTDNEGVVLDADTDCTIEKVLGICCTFTTMPKHEVEHLFLPEIGQVRDAIRKIDERHEAFVDAQNDKLKQLHEKLENRLTDMMSYLADQQTESESAKIKTTQTFRKADELQGRFAEITSNMATGRNIELERKQLLHFMVFMKNKLLRQTIDTDRLWVLANAEKSKLAQPAGKSSNAK